MQHHCADYPFSHVLSSQLPQFSVFPCFLASRDQLAMLFTLLTVLYSAFVQHTGEFASSATRVMYRTSVYAHMQYRLLRLKGDRRETKVKPQQLCVMWELPVSSSL